MPLFILIALAFWPFSSWGMTQCPAGSESGFMWRCVAIPIEDTVAKIAHYDSAKSACSLANPAKSADYAARLQYLMSTRNLWPGEKLRERPEYLAVLANANQRMQLLGPPALERECDFFLDIKK